MIIRYSPSFIASLKKTNVRVRKSFKERIVVFSRYPFDSHLNNHSLKREYKGYRSIDITANWRAIYQERQEGEEVIAYFIQIGTHTQIYRG